MESKALTSPELAASGGGHLHQVTVEVDPALISLPGRYYFALSVDDDHSDAEKAHRTKPALQAGSTHCVPVEIAVVHPTDYIEYDPGSQDPDRSQPHLTFDLMHAPASVPITYEVKLYPVVGSSLVDPLKVYHYEITDVGDGAAALDLAAVDYNDFSVRAVEYAEWTLLRDVGVHDDFIGKLNILGLGGCHFLFSGEDVDGRAVLKNAALVWPGGANFTSDTESWDEFPGPNFGAYAASEQRKLKDGSEYASDNAMDSWALPAYHAMGLDAIVYIQGHGGVGAQHTTGRAADVNELNLDPAHRPLYDAYTIVNSP